MAEQSIGRGTGAFEHGPWTGRCLSRVDRPLTAEELRERADDEKFGRKVLRDVKKAIHRLRRWNFDQGTGQPGWVHTMADERRAPQKFAAVCGNVGPAESTGRGKVCFRFNWGRDRSLLGSTPAAVRGGGGRIAFSAPPQIYPEVDTSSRNFLRLCEASRFGPCDDPAHCTHSHAGQFVSPG